MNTALELVSSNTQNTEINTMSSREIAELTGKRHDSVIRDIEGLLKTLGLEHKNFISSYLSCQGKSCKCYKLPRSAQDILMQKYEYKHRALGSREHGALCTIEQLNGVKLIRQYQVGKYRIDGYCIETNTAYEIDEEHHFTSSNEAKDTERQQYIEDILGCNFVRINVSYKKVK